MAEQRFTYKVDTDSPLSVEDFSRALIAINNEYKCYSCNQKELQICEVRKGSYEVEFISVLIPSLFAALENSNTILDFCSHLKRVKDYIVGTNVSQQKPNEQSIRNCIEITQPIIHNHGTINIITGNEKVVVIDSEEAQQVKTLSPQVIKEIGTMDEAQPQTNIYRKKLFYWYQTRFDDKKSNSGNKGIIESIQPEAVNVIFEDDNSLTKTEMTTSHDGVDWQKRGYIVDIEVLRKGDKIVKYKILQNYMDESVVDDTLF